MWRWQSGPLRPHPHPCLRLKLARDNGTTRTPMRNRSEYLREAGLAALVLFVSSYAWMFSRVSVPNERTRAYLTMAIVDHGSFAVDEPLRRFGSVYDLAQFGGHYFTDKAPGASL